MEMTPMKALTSFFASFGSVIMALFFFAPSAANVAPQASGQLVYADFEKMQNGRPVSARGGWIQLQNNQENPGTPAKFKGMQGANDAPELVHLKADDPNKAAMFSY